MSILVETYLLNVIIISFPIILYTIFYSFKEKFKEGENDTVLEITLIATNFLIMCFYFILKKDYNLFTVSIPLLFAFLFSKPKTAILLSIIDVVIIYKIIELNIWFYILIVPVFFLFYRIYITTTKSEMFLVNSFALISVLYITACYYIFFDINMNYLKALIVYIFSIYTIFLILYKVKNAINLYSTLKEIEDDKRWQTAIYKIAHEIKNPLAVMKGYLSIFNTKDKAKCDKYVNILKTEVDNALLVLKDFSEINHLTINKQEFDFNKLILEIKETVFPFFNDKNIDYSFKCENNLIINADYNRLKQVLINIIKNAVEACEINGNIELNSYKSGNNLILTIRDNGCGMDKDTLENLFMLFYSKKQNGTGLGLCLSKEIIELHGGSIKYSSSVGKHTTAKIVLPI